MRKLVEIKPITKSKWYGNDDDNNYSRPKVIGVLVDPITKKYATGLSEEDRKHFEKELGVNLSDNFDPEQVHSYFQSKAARIKLMNHTTVLDPNITAQALQLKFLKASKHVANSMKEYQEGKWPHASHYLYDVNEEVEEKASKLQITNEARKIVLSMSLESQINMVLLMTNENTANQSPNYVAVKLDDAIAAEPAKFHSFIAMGKDEVVLRSTVLKLIDKNILTRKGQAIYYIGNLLANTYEDAILYFKEDQNQQQRVAIFEQLMIK